VTSGKVRLVDTLDKSIWHLSFRLILKKENEKRIIMLNGMEGSKNNKS